MNKLAFLITMAKIQSQDPERFHKIMDEALDEHNDSSINITSEKQLDELNKKLDHPIIKEKGLYSLEYSTEMAKNVGIDFDKVWFNPLSFNYVMNMVHADDYEFIKKFEEATEMKPEGTEPNLQDSDKLYAFLAWAWIGDEDAPKQKLMNYIKYIVDYKGD